MIKLCLVELAPLPVAFLLLVAGPQDGWAKKNKELTDPCQGWWDCNQFAPITINLRLLSISASIRVMPIGQSGSKGQERLKRRAPIPNLGIAGSGEPKPSPDRHTRDLSPSWITGAEALKGTSAGGQGFDCNEPGIPGRCSCRGPSDSADCKAMKKNCADDINCGWAVDNCTCTFKPLASRGGGKTQRAPAAGGVAH